MKRTALRRKSRTIRKVRKVATKGYKPPKWFTSLPAGSHGNTPAQKKAWKAISQLVRRRDFEQYGGKCVSCPTRLSDWREGDCGHYKAWSVCHGFFKYEVSNLALQCKGCNRLSDGTVGTRFGIELQRRYGKSHLDWLEKENEKHRGEKLEEWLLVELTAKLRPDLVHETH
jgi:hypothetical protein